MLEFIGTELSIHRNKMMKTLQCFGEYEITLIFVNVEILKTDNV